MTDYTVTNLNNSGAGSLSEAMLSAEFYAGADTITFDAALSGGTITLLQAYFISFGNELTIDGDLDNDGVADITLSGDANGNGINDVGDVFHLSVFAGGVVDIDGINFTGGRRRGADGNAGNDGSIGVGSIINEGTLTLRNGSFTNNQGYGGAGGDGLTSGTDGGEGGLGAGAILNFSDLTLLDMTFDGNEGHGGAGGNGADGDDGTAEFLNENGQHGANGGNAGVAGAIVNLFGATVNMAGTTFLNGVANSLGAGIGGRGGDGFSGVDSNGGDGGDGGDSGLVSYGIANLGIINGQSHIGGSGFTSRSIGSGGGAGAAGGAGIPGSNGDTGFFASADPSNHATADIGEDNSDRVLTTFLSAGLGNDIILNDGDVSFYKPYAGVPTGTFFLQGFASNGRLDTAYVISASDFGYASDPNVENSGIDAHLTINRFRGSGQEDFWQFEVLERGQVILDIDNTQNAGLDAVLTLYNEAGVLIRFNNDNGSDPGSPFDNLDSKIETFLEPGIYVVRVQDLTSNSIDIDEGYHLHITLPGRGVITSPAVTGRPETLYGWDGHDKLFGQIGDDTLNGNDGNDILVGGVGGDTQYGGDGYDMASYEDATNGVTANLLNAALNSGDALGDTYSSIEGLIGSDHADNLTGTNGGSAASPEEIHGGDGDDQLFGLGGIDTLFGDSGNDTLNGGDGEDHLAGGAGDDFLIGGADVDTLYGGSGNDTLDGGDGHDTLAGGAGDDVLIGGTGIDVLLGGSGSDTASYVGATTGVTVLFDNFIFNTGDAFGDYYASIENIEGSSHDDTLYGNDSDNNLSGGDGDDYLEGKDGIDHLFGGAGRDQLRGGAGSDAMLGGDGNDIYYVDDAGDTVSEFADEGYDIVHATGIANFTLGANVERIIFDDTINHVAKGNALDNRLNGNAGKDKFLIDEGGADIFSGGSSRDVFDARASTTGIKVYLNNQDNNAGATAGDFFASIEVFSGSSTASDTMRGGTGRSRFAGNGGDDVLIGNNNIDFLQGGADNDTIYGGSGRDTLQGGSGDDLLDGGNARDQFLYVKADFGHDTIVDFQDDLDYFKIWSGNNPGNGVADDISDFTITGNGTSTVTVTLNADPTSIITVNSFDGNAMTIDAGDFQFY